MTEMENHSLEPSQWQLIRQKVSMYAKVGGWNFDEEQDIGIISEYPPHTHKILISDKGKNQ